MRTIVVKKASSVVHVSDCQTSRKFHGKINLTKREKSTKRHKQKQKQPTAHIREKKDRTMFRVKNAPSTTCHGTTDSNEHHVSAPLSNCPQSAFEFGNRQDDQVKALLMGRHRYHNTISTCHTKI